MTHIRRFFVPVAVTASVVAAAGFLLIPAGSAADNPTLEANVGPGFTISLKTSSGANVTHLDVGTYTIHVNDQSPFHSFHLSGPGVDQATTVEDTGMVTWTVALTDGLYHFQCDAHPSQMKGDFAVGSAVLPPPPPPPPPPGVAKGTKLKGSVGPGFTISLKDGAGKPVKKVKSGTTYTISVTDKSAAHNFHLFGTGVNKKTAIGAKAKATWKLKFKKGKTYRFHCDAHPTVLKGSFKAV